MHCHNVYGAAIRNPILPSRLCFSLLSSVENAGEFQDYFYLRR